MLELFILLMFETIELLLLGDIGLTEKLADGDIMLGVRSDIEDWVSGLRLFRGIFGMTGVGADGLVY